MQCELNFQDWPKDFWTDRAKVSFAQSYLKGIALEWFKPDLLRMDDPYACPLWMTSWREVVIKLQTTFSPHDPIANAKHQLDHLRMKDTHCINCYVGNFNRIASQVQGYGDGALRTTSILVSPTKLRMRSAASVNYIPLMASKPSPKKLMPDTGNIRKRSLVKIRPQPALVPIPTLLVNPLASWKKASHPQTTLPSPHPC